MKSILFALISLSISAQASPKFREGDHVKITDAGWSDNALFHNCDEVKVWKVESLNIPPQVLASCKNERSYDLYPYEDSEHCAGLVITTCEEDLQKVK